MQGMSGNLPDASRSENGPMRPRLLSGGIGVNKYTASSVNTTTDSAGDRVAGEGAAVMFIVP
jgi:hypothetical protein